MLLNKNNYKFIPFYKSLLFRFTTFKTNSKDPQDIIIVNALNIKNRKKRITYLYDSTCKYIDDYYKNKNICGFKNCKCYKNLKDGCCRKCIYKSDKGCTTKNLACKLFNCSEVYSRRKVITYNDLKTLKILTIRQRLIIKSDYFSTREDVLKDLYSYSIFYSTIRIVFRLTKNLIILHFKENKNI